MAAALLLFRSLYPGKIRMLEPYQKLPESSVIEGVKRLRMIALQPSHLLHSFPQII